MELAHRYEITYAPPVESHRCSCGHFYDSVEITSMSVQQATAERARIATRFAEHVESVYRDAHCSEHPLVHLQNGSDGTEWTLHFEGGDACMAMSKDGTYRTINDIYRVTCADCLHIYIRTNVAHTYRIDSDSAHGNPDYWDPPGAAFAEELTQHDTLSDEAFHDECAMRAMQAIATEDREQTADQDVRLAFNYADAMLAERKRRRGE